MVPPALDSLMAAATAASLIEKDPKKSDTMTENSQAKPDSFPCPTGNFVSAYSPAQRRETTGPDNADPC